MVTALVLVVVLSAIGASKGVVFGPVITDAAFFMFPIAYILGDVITEIYGPKAAKRAIITGFLANLASVAVYAIIIALPGFDDDYGIAKQAAIENALGPVWQVVAASMLGYICGQSANSFIMWVSKKRHLETRLYTRLASSSGVGEAIDTIIFCTVAAPVIGITSFAQWGSYTFFGFLWKVVVQYAMIPLTAAGIRWVKAHEPTYGDLDR